MDTIKFKVSVVNKIDKTLCLELLVNGKNILEWKSKCKIGSSPMGYRSSYAQSFHERFHGNSNR